MRSQKLEVRSQKFGLHAVTLPWTFGPSLLTSDFSLLTFQGVRS
jgi:hypothetical protein